MKFLRLISDKEIAAIILALTFVIVLIALTSCSVTKNLHKYKHETKTDVTTQTMITQTVTEKADSVFTLKGDTVKGFSDNLELTPIIEFKDGLELIVTEDPKTHKVTATAIKIPEKIHLTVDKITVSNEVSHSQSKSDFKNSTSDLHKEVTGGINWNWIWVIVAGIIVYLFWRFMK